MWTWHMTYPFPFTKLRDQAGSKHTESPFWQRHDCFVMPLVPFPYHKPQLCFQEMLLKAQFYALSRDLKTDGASTEHHWSSRFGRDLNKKGHFNGEIKLHPIFFKQIIQSTQEEDWNILNNWRRMWFNSNLWTHFWSGDWCLLSLLS